MSSFANELGEEDAPRRCDPLLGHVDEARHLWHSLRLAGCRRSRALRVNVCLTSLSVQDLEDDGLRVLGAALHSNPRNRLSCAV